MFAFTLNAPIRENAEFSLSNVYVEELIDNIFSIRIFYSKIL